MKDITQIKQELIAFDIKYSTFKGRLLKTIKGNTLTELFNNISINIGWYKITPEKAKEFNSIFNNQLVIENNILLCNCTGLESVTIPNSVISIGNSAFECCTELISVILPNSITTIRHCAFESCKKLKSIVIPNSVDFIGEYTFADCTELTSITIPASIISIGEYIFEGCRKDLEVIRI